MEMVKKNGQRNNAQIYIQKCREKKKKFMIVCINDKVIRFQTRVKVPQSAKAPNRCGHFDTQVIIHSDTFNSSWFNR